MWESGQEEKEVAGEEDASIEKFKEGEVDLIG